MRIIGGKFGRRRFNPPANNWPTRPTTDYAKEALYNILQNKIDFEETKMLDLFGGTGNHCYEFLSRGSTDVTYVDSFGKCVAFVKKTANELDVKEDLTVLKSDVFRFIKSTNQQFDFIFADPPYNLKALNQLPDLILDNDLLAVDGMLVIEHDQQNSFEEHKRFVEVRKYGGCMFSFFG